MINLDRFTEIKQVIVPIIKKTGKYNGRKINLNVEDGWYKINLGDTASVLKKASQFEIVKTLEPLKKITGYPIGTELVPENFDVFFRNGKQDKLEVNFLDVSLFQEVEIVKWEDGRYYFYDTKISNKQQVIQRIREAFTDRKSLSDVQGVTPELRYYFLLCLLRNELLESLHELKVFAFAEDKQTDWAQYIKKSFSVRLKEVIERANGTFIRYEEQGSNFLVVWKLGGQTVKSVINKEMRILNAGFCLSGHDREHSMNSIINLAKTYQDDMPLHITHE